VPYGGVVGRQGGVTLHHRIRRTVWDHYLESPHSSLHQSLRPVGGSTSAPFCRTNRAIPPVPIQYAPGNAGDQRNRTSQGERTPIVAPVSAAARMGHPEELAPPARDQPL
jgi:hypothetical protein